MNIERIIGILEEQGRWQAKKLEEIDRKVDALVAFKWRALGGAGLAAFFATLIVEFFRH